jgi:hypothetical protein
MQQNHPAQLIKPEQREHTETTTVLEAEPDAESSAHEIRPGITGWVRDHEHRSEEYRRAFKDLLTEEGFHSTRTTDFRHSSPKRKM